MKRLLPRAADGRLCVALTARAEPPPAGRAGAQCRPTSSSAPRSATRTAISRTASSPETARWMKAHSERTKATLARIPGRAALLDKLLRYDQATPARVARAAAPAATGCSSSSSGRAGQPVQAVPARVACRGARRVLVDPEALARKFGKPHAINWFSASPDGAARRLRHLAAGLGGGGAARARHAQRPADRRSRSRAPSSAASTGRPTAARCVFNRLQALPNGAPDTEKYQNSQVYLLRRARRSSSAVPVFGTAVGGLAHRAGGGAVRRRSPTTGAGRSAIAGNGTQREISLYVAPQAGVAAPASRSGSGCSMPAPTVTGVGLPRRHAVPAVARRRAALQGADARSASRPVIGRR